MNIWAVKTARLASREDYLDRLQEIYPVVPGIRNVPEKVLGEIRKAFDSGDRIRLLNILLDQEKFPYEESYKKFLKDDRSAIARNPKTVERICNSLFELGREGVISGVTAPKAPNQTRGNQFRRWAQENFSFVAVEEFESSKTGIVFLDAPEENLRNYANAQLGAGLSKRPDLVAKAGRKHIIGEAKFLSDEGGNQRAGFRDAMAVAGLSSGRAVKVAILDGVVWLKNISYYKQIETSSVNVFTALLLKDFLKSLL